MPTPPPAVDSARPMPGRHRRTGQPGDACLVTGHAPRHRRPSLDVERFSSSRCTRDTWFRGRRASARTACRTRRSARDPGPAGSSCPAARAARCRVRRRFPSLPRTDTAGAGVRGRDPEQRGADIRLGHVDGVVDDHRGPQVIADPLPAYADGGLVAAHRSPPARVRLLQMGRGLHQGVALPHAGGETAPGVTLVVGRMRPPSIQIVVSCSRIDRRPWYATTSWAASTCGTHRIRAAPASSEKSHACGRHTARAPRSSPAPSSARATGRPHSAAGRRSPRPARCRPRCARAAATCPPGQSVQIQVARSTPPAPPRALSASNKA